MNSTSKSEVTAAILVIGDEILSGRTQDQNISEIANMCSQGGIDLREARIVADAEQDIVDAVNALRERYTYVFTTGGIGPTHDDITAQAIARAFDVELLFSEAAKAAIVARFGEDSLTEQRLRMARIPKGASLIDNPVTAAPGFKLENVHVMAGVPKIMRAMLGQIAPTLNGGNIIHAKSILVGVGESVVAESLEKIEKDHAGIKIGSYPRLGEKPVYTEVVLRGADLALLNEATQKVQEVVDELHLVHNVSLGSA